MAHGTCPQVGIGGHATIGGLGPSSRLWGAALDHIEEVEVVLADSSIVRASATQNADLFFALKGAGASFGIITEFVVRTEEAPGEAVHYSFSFTLGSYASMAGTFKKWQDFISNPKLTRKFASEVIISDFGMAISGTYFGTKAEYDGFQLGDKFPGNQATKTLHFRDWLGLVAHWGDVAAQKNAGGLEASFYTKTLTFGVGSPIPKKTIDEIFTYLDKAEKGTPIWFMIFDLAGGTVNEVPMGATAYAHRDALFYLQSYGIDVLGVNDTTRNFLRGINKTFKDGMPNADFGAYPGYVDPEISNAQAEYWRSNLPRLEEIKAKVDPADVFHNPQSVRPAGGAVEVAVANGGVANRTSNGASNGTAKASAAAAKKRGRWRALLAKLGHRHG